MAATYATLADIRARYPYRQITGASTPTDTQVQKWLDAAQATLDGALQSVGLPAPYADATAKLILGEWVIDYAIGRIREAYASANGELDQNNSEDPLVAGFKRKVADIVNDPSIAGAMLGGGSDPPSTPSLRSYFSSGASITEDDFLPIFQRSRGEGNF